MSEAPSNAGPPPGRSYRWAWVLVALDHIPALLPLAFVPMTLKVIYGAARWQDKRSLSLPRLGVIEMIHSLLFAVLVIAAF